MLWPFFTYAPKRSPKPYTSSPTPSCSWMALNTSDSSRAEPSIVTPNSPTGCAVTLDSALSLKRASDLPEDAVSVRPAASRNDRLHGEPLTTLAVRPPVVSMTSAPFSPTSPSPLPCAATVT